MKTLKSTKSCDALCKRYVTKLNRRFSKHVPPYKPNKEENERNYKDCRRLYCNEQCNGALINGTKKNRMNFKNIKHSFHKNFTKK